MVYIRAPTLGLAGVLPPAGRGFCCSYQLKEA